MRCTAVKYDILTKHITNVCEQIGIDRRQKTT